MNFSSAKYMPNWGDNTKEDRSFKIKNRWGPQRKLKNLTLSLVPLDESIDIRTSTSKSTGRDDWSVSRNSMRSTASMQSANPNSICSQHFYNKRLQMAQGIIKNGEMETVFNLLLSINKLQLNDVHNGPKSRSGRSLSTSSIPSKSRNNSRSYRNNGTVKNGLDLVDMMVEDVDCMSSETSRLLSINPFVASMDSIIAFHHSTHTSTKRGIQTYESISLAVETFYAELLQREKDDKKELSATMKTAVCLNLFIKVCSSLGTYYERVWRPLLWELLTSIYSGYSRIYPPYLLEKSTEKLLNLPIFTEEFFVAEELNVRLMKAMSKVSNEYIKSDKMNTCDKRRELKYNKKTSDKFIRNMCFKLWKRLGHRDFYYKGICFKKHLKYRWERWKKYIVYMKQKNLINIKDLETNISYLEKLSHLLEEYSSTTATSCAQLNEAHDPHPHSHIPSHRKTTHGGIPHTYKEGRKLIDGRIESLFNYFHRDVDKAYAAYCVAEDKKEERQRVEAERRAEVFLQPINSPRESPNESSPSEATDVAVSDPTADDNTDPCTPSEQNGDAGDTGDTGAADAADAADAAVAAGDAAGDDAGDVGEASSSEMPESRKGDPNSDIAPSVDDQVDDLVVSAPSVSVPVESSSDSSDNPAEQTVVFIDVGSDQSTAQSCTPSRVSSNPGSRPSTSDASVDATVDAVSASAEDLQPPSRPSTAFERELEARREQERIKELEIYNRKTHDLVDICCGIVSKMLYPPQSSRTQTAEWYLIDEKMQQILSQNALSVENPFAEEVNVDNLSSTDDDETGHLMAKSLKLPDPFEGVLNIIALIYEEQLRLRRIEGMDWMVDLLTEEDAGDMYIEDQPGSALSSESEEDLQYFSMLQFSREFLLTRCDGNRKLATKWFKEIVKSCLGFDDKRNANPRIVLFTELCGIQKSSMRDLQSLLLTVEEQEDELKASEITEEEKEEREQRKREEEEELKRARLEKEETYGIIDEEKTWEASSRSIDVEVALREAVYSPAASHKCAFFFKAVNRISKYNKRLITKCMFSESRNIDRQLVLNAIKSIFPRLEARGKSGKELFLSLKQEILGLPSITRTNASFRGESRHYVNIDKVLDTIMDYYDLEYELDIQGTFMYSRPGTPD